MKNIPIMLLSFWLFILTVVAQACPTPTNLAYDGQARTEIVYDGTSVPDPDYDSAPMLPASETRNPTARTSDAFVDFPEFLAAEGAGSEVTALTKFYPENSGFAGATERTFLMPGQTID